jgi:hypothetical protein
MKRFDHKIFSLVALALLAGACVVNMEEGAPPPDDGERLVTLALSVPAPPASRAMEVEDENAVNTVDVLLFTTDGNDHFRYRALGSTPADDGDNSHKTFTVRLPEGTWNVVVLANARAQLAGVPPATLADPGTGRVTLLDGLVQQLSATNKKWTEDGFNGIPMWGYHNGFNVEATTPPTIQLTRALARVNVSVRENEKDEEDGPRDVFEMTGVFLYNYSTAGSLTPGAGAIGVNGGYLEARWKDSEGKALAPNVPGASSRIKEPLEYDVDPADKHAFNREIYTFEAEGGGGTDAELETNTCLVIRGSYKGTGPRYYRVDFIKKEKDKADEYLALLRNHSYNVVIQSVDGDGYPTEEAAFRNKPSNIKAEVLEWDESTIGDIIFDGQNYIGVSPTEIVLQGSSKAGNQITVKSSAAWTHEVVYVDGEADQWIQNLSGAFSAPGNKDAITFNVPINETGADRSANIHIKAGWLDFVVKVKQFFVSEARVWATTLGGEPITGLFFTSASGVQPGEQKFLLNWFPPEDDVTASVSGTFDYAPGSDTPGEGTLATIGDPANTGMKIITVRPPALNMANEDPFEDKVSTVHLAISHGEGTEYPMDFELRHHNYHTEAITEDVYILDGEEHSFFVRSNVSWVITGVSDNVVLEDEPVLLGVTGGGNTTAQGEEVKFRVITGTTELRNGVAYVTLHDPAERVEDVIVTLNCGTCGAGGTATLLPVGTKMYLTHVYGTGADQRCWMVQNSSEGTVYSARAFAIGPNGEELETWYENDNRKEENANGYYYSFYDKQVANNACPTGWRLPTDAEFVVMAAEVALDPTGVGKWWTDAEHGAFAGFRDAVFRMWKQEAYWWAAASYHAHYSKDLATENQGGMNYLMNVRCVQE